MKRLVLSILIGLALATAVWSASFFGVYARNEEAKLDGNRELVEVLEQRLRNTVQTARSPATPAISDLCISGFWGEPCVLVRVAKGMPPCPALEQEGGCRAVEMDAALFAVPGVRDVVERETGTLCTFVEGSVDSGRFRVANNFDCQSPGPAYRLFYRYQPTLCVFLLENGQRVDRFAVRSGRRVHHYWCDRFK